jgi:biopolymer transport protein ExbD
VHSEITFVTDAGTPSSSSPLVFEQDDHLPKPRRREPRGVARTRMGLNLAAMIDVVFLLLIFFMVATRFKLGEEIYRLDLPERGEAVAADPFQLDEEPLRISITSHGREAYRIELDGPYDRPRTFAELHQFLLDRQIRPGHPEGLFPPDHPIIVQPSATTRWEHAISVFNAAVRARYTNISFAETGERS